MSVFGLTGGIGAGKSTVAGMFQDSGIPVVLADDVGRQVVSTGSQGLSAVVALFGEDVLDGGGSLDRRKLGGIIFNDPAKRAQLEGILHPLVRDRSRELFAQLKDAGNSVIVYESALLFETKRDVEMMGVMLVTASEAVRIARVRERDGSEESEVRRRIQAQMDEEEKRGRCEYIIENDGDILGLKNQVADLITHLIQRSN